jgi:hypothetical protein
LDFAPGFKLLDVEVIRSRPPFPQHVGQDRASSEVKAIANAVTEFLEEKAAAQSSALIDIQLRDDKVQGRICSAPRSKGAPFATTVEEFFHPC